MADELLTERTEHGVAYLTLNRPDCLNAFSLAVAEQLSAALSDCARDPAIRAVVLRGEGRVFSAGGDVKRMLADVTKGEDPAAYFRAPLSSFHAAVLAVRDLPKPVLAAVHGAVAGFAWNLVLACDLVLAQQGTRFAQAFIRLGLSPDGGGTFFLPRLVGYARACELTMLPTEIDADQARAWGLVNWVVPADAFHAKVEEIAGQLATGPAPAIARVKRLLNQQLRSDLGRQLDAERAAQIENSGGDDFREGLTAFVEKRPPDFVRAPGQGRR